MAIGKRLQVKMYDSGNVLRATILDANVSGYSWGINGGPGALTLTFARPITDFGEGADIGLLFRVEIRVFDLETDASGVLVYQGYVESYEQDVRGEQESVIVNCVGYQALFNKLIHKNDSATTVSYTSQDPAYMLKDIVAKAGTRITTTAASVENTGLSLSYTFRNNKVKDAIDKIIDLAPNYYYWYLDPNNVLYFGLSKFGTVDFALGFRKDYVEINVKKSVANMVNVEYFVGGGSPNLYRKTTRNSSVAEFGTFEDTLTDERVTNTNSADQIVSTALDKVDHPTVSVRIKLVDSNYSDGSLLGFDLEKLRPGQIVQLRNLADERTTLWDQAVWDVDFFDFDFLGALANPFIISKITFSANLESAVIEMGELRDTFAVQWNDLEQRLSNTQLINLPTSPTTV